MNTANLLNLDPVEAERLAYADGLPVAALLGRIIERDEKLDLAWTLWKLNGWHMPMDCQWLHC